ncbi:MAG: Cd(II)/Pb(II)-responsive transcriptional regulator [Pelomonas sp.]|nr:Cd(II)/Pb(II)-responsive transcriptional regulator [Roseateles sp.]
MKIGELAAATDTPIETIRYYERAGLLPQPKRSEGNFRLYDEANVERLNFIRACRALDMSLDEVRVLLGFRDGADGDCTAVNALLDAHIEHVQARIAELRELSRELRGLREQCREVQAAGHCGILRGLDTNARQAKPRAAAKARSHVHATHDHPHAKR